MREIKFKAWLPGINKMTYEHTLDELIAMNWNDEDWKKGTAVWLQYTGLKDRNGKEIYESDILSTDLSRPYLIVVYRNGAFMLQCHDSEKDYFDYMGATDEDLKMMKYSEVLGNTFEHPHLLKGEEA